MVVRVGVVVVYVCVWVGGLPECFGGHVCGGYSVVDQRLVPHWVQGVLQRLRAEFVRLEGGGRQEGGLR